MKLNTSVIKTTYIVAVSLLVLVFGSLAVIAYLQAPPSSDTSVSGFGPNTTTSLYGEVALLMANTHCEQVLYPEYQLFETFPVLQTSNYPMTSEKLPTDIKNPFSCRYDFGNGKFVYFNVYTYTEDIKSDPDRKTLIARVNNSLSKITDSGRLGLIDYYLAADTQDSTICRSTLLHPLNDFEYASIAYDGFNCSEVTALNRELVSIFGNYIVTSLEYIYTTYGNTTTEDLLVKWGYSELVDDLNSYAEID